MAARLYDPNFDQSRFDEAQIGGDYYREVAEHYLIPKIKERAKQALNVAPELMSFYQRSYVGRRCSCWLSIESSPSVSCLVCYGTGNTDGYQRYGHRTEVCDVTSSCATVGVIVDYQSVTRPLQFRLADQFLCGYVEFLVPVLGGSLQGCSLASLYASTPRGTRVRAGVKLWEEPAFVPFGTDAVAARLAKAAATGGLVLRVWLERDSVSAQSPRLSHCRVRYQTLASDVVRGDAPRSVDAARSSDFGWFDDVQTKNLYTDSTLRSITTEDFFRFNNTGKTYKCVSVNPNAPAGVLTSWDCEIRQVQGSERYVNIP